MIPSRWTAAVIMLALVWFTSARVFENRPFEGDNLYILHWADSQAAGDLLRVDPAVYPEWRPLPYLTIWLQYQWATIEHMWAYNLINLLLWAVSGWLVSCVVFALSGSTLAGVIAGVVVLTSTQLIDSQVLIDERQSSMACLFGLAAWLVVIRAWDGPPAGGAWVGVALLLALSGLSKEYGLAFACAIGVFAVWERRWEPAVAATAAVAVYSVLRMGFAGGALAPYCEDHGYFFTARAVCFDQITGQAVTQGLYNLVATGLGSLLPGLFSDDGRIGISPRWLLMSLLLLTIAVFGWAKGPKANRIGLLVVVFNAVLSPMLYRFRNQVVALCAVGVAVGVGLPFAERALRRVAPSRVVRMLAVLMLASTLSMRALVMRTLLSDRVDVSSRPDACGPDIPDLDRAFMERLWRQYDLRLPECAGVDDSR